MAPKKRSPPFSNHGSSLPRHHASPSPDLEPSSASTPKAKRTRQPRDSPSDFSLAQPLAQLPVDLPYLSPPAPDSPRPSSEGTGPEDDSRRQSTSSTMRTSSMPFEGVPTATPTGRISKAKKGKRVHACSFDGCGKVFTRAEHRRRHELNHNPEAMFPCTRPGCRKAFHRLDLLQRHQERHDLENQLEAQAGHHRQLSQLSGSSDAPSTMPPATMSSPATTQAGPRTSSGGLSIGSLVHPQTEYRYNLASPHFNGFSRPAMPFTNGFTSSDDYNFYTPESSQSPVSEQYGKYPHRQSISSSSSVAAFDPSAASPLIHNTSHWMPSSAPPSMLPANMFDDSAYMPTLPYQYPSPPWMDMNGLSYDENYHLHLESYPPMTEMHFHPYFPVVYRPTFLPRQPSPLLASAMMAIGSHFDHRSDSKLYSLTLLEIATRLLRRRDSITSRSRLADLQTVFLLEVLSKYCSRRVEVEMSSRFRSLFASLDQARRSLATNPLAVFRTLRPDYTQEDLTKAHKFWVEHETRRRILQASSILDMLQTSFFEQPATVMQHGRTRLSTEIARTNISLPSADEIWETSPIEKWAELAKNYENPDPAKLKKSDAPVQNEDLDYFQIQAWVATDSGAFSDMLFDQQFLGLSPMASSPRKDCLLFNKRAIALAKHTPLKSLLIVSGESWILGKKLESESEFQAAKQTLRSWVNAGGDSLTALWNATSLLRSQITFPADATAPWFSAVFEDTHMLHEPWCLYLATLVCWAHGLHPSLSFNSSGVGSAAVSIASEPVSHQSSSSSSSAHPSLLDAADAAFEAQQYLHNTNVPSPQDLLHLDPIPLGRIHGLLELVRMQKIGPLTGGLMNEAERVLFRLVEGRSTLSHF